MFSPLDRYVYSKRNLHNVYLYQDFYFRIVRSWIENVLSKFTYLYCMTWPFSLDEKYVEIYCTIGIVAKGKKTLLYMFKIVFQFCWYFVNDKINIKK